MRDNSWILKNVKGFLSDGIRQSKRDQLPPANTIFSEVEAAQKEKHYQEVLEYLLELEEEIQL